MNEIMKSVFLEVVAEQLIVFDVLCLFINQIKTIKFHNFFTCRSVLQNVVHYNSHIINV